jgi:hypothetical protein
MTSQKKIKTGERSDAVNDPRHCDWSPMKPFVKFGIGAIKVLAHALIFIVKGALKLRPETEDKKPGKKVIKI